MEVLYVETLLGQPTKSQHNSILLHFEVTGTSSIDKITTFSFFSFLSSLTKNEGWLDFVLKEYRMKKTILIMYVLIYD
jgi:hypothetical protein